MSSVRKRSPGRVRRAGAVSILVSVVACGGSGTSSTNDPRLPLVLIADADLPGAANRFDYQDIDAAHGHLVIAHMNDASVIVANLADGSVAKVLPNIPTARGVAVASDVGRIFVTSSPNSLVIIDSVALSEIRRVETGDGPDGVAWDPKDAIVAVSDQGDGGVSLIPNAGDGTRTQVKLGSETGNVIFDEGRSQFWITVVDGSANKIVGIDPVGQRITTTLDLPGCSGAHGLRLDPQGQSALVACEENDTLARVDLANRAPVVTASTGAGPDVLSVDSGLGWLYVSAESGDLTVFDLSKPGLVQIDSEHPGDAAHTVAVDPMTHHVFFPLAKGASGTPVLRIMKPSGM